MLLINATWKVAIRLSRYLGRKSDMQLELLLVLLCLFTNSVKGVWKSRGVWGKAPTLSAGCLHVNCAGLTTRSNLGWIWRRLEVLCSSSDIEGWIFWVRARITYGEGELQGVCCFIILKWSVAWLYFTVLGMYYRKILRLLCGEQVNWVSLSFQFFEVKFAWVWN